MLDTPSRLGPGNAPIERVEADILSLTKLSAVYSRIAHTGYR